MEQDLMLRASMKLPSPSQNNGCYGFVTMEGVVYKFFSNGNCWTFISRKNVVGVDHDGFFSRDPEETSHQRPVEKFFTREAPAMLQDIAKRKVG